MAISPRYSVRIATRARSEFVARFSLLALFRISIPRYRAISCRDLRVAIIAARPSLVHQSVLWCLRFSIN